MNRISIASPVFNGNEKKYLMECIDTGWISSNGKFIKEFEDKFSNFCECDYSLACSNGTVSLHLILHSMGIKAGDEVIIPNLTYIATANTVKYCNAKPVLCESDAKTWNIDPYSIESKITENTKAIIPVHLYGLPADMDPIMKIAEKYNLFVIEDAAEAHGATYKGKKVGSIGHAGSFSFFGNKIITCGEGGMVTTSDNKLYEKMKLLRSQGVDPNKKYWHSEMAFNYRMTNMQAAVGLGQLENVKWHLEQRQRIASYYKKYMKKIEDLIDVQYIENESTHVYWMNALTLNDSVKLTRDEVMAKMELKNIEMRPLFYNMSEMPPYLEDSELYPISKRISSRGINLPSHALMSENDVKYIIDSLEEIIR